MKEGLTNRAVKDFLATVTPKSFFIPILVIMSLDAAVNVLFCTRNVTSVTYEVEVYTFTSSPLGVLIIVFESSSTTSGHSSKEKLHVYHISVLRCFPVRSTDHTI
jgi:hypothetical protein